MPVPNGFLYAWGEALKNLFRNKWISGASIGVVAVTLLMLGTFLAISLNINRITLTVKEQVEITLFIDDEATAAERSDLRSMLAANDSIAGFNFVSREEAWTRLAELYGDFVEGYRDAGENPLRDSYEVRPVVPEEVGDLARELESYPGVGDVRNAPQEFIDNLFAVIRVLQMVGLGLMVGLAVTAVFLIAHTIKLTVFIRRREIMIMKYVGATNWFIRWPFILEGLVIGLIGAIVPLVAISMVYQASIEWLAGQNLFFIDMVQVSAIRLELIKYLLPLGCGLGVFGSLLSMDRFLRV